MYRLIALDLDGTLAAAGQPVTGEVAAAVAALLDRFDVCVLEAAAEAELVARVADRMPDGADTGRLRLVPATDAAAALAAQLAGSGLRADEVFFVGDELGVGGVDRPVVDLGVTCRAVTGPDETVTVLAALARPRVL